MPRIPQQIDIPALGELDKTQGQLGRQLAQALRDAVQKGNLRAGDPLPSSRALAQSLGVSRGTVVEAFEQLLAEGILESHPGASTRVSWSLKTSLNSKVSTEKHGQATTPVVLSAAATAFANVAKEFTPLPQVPFAVSVPLRGAQPDDAWRKIGNRIRASRGRPSGYDDPQGVLELRKAVTDYIRRSRSVHCRPEQVIITGGIQQALYICCQILFDAGDKAWVEDPAYRGITAILEHAAKQLSMIRVPVDAGGIQVNTGIERAANARAAFVTPSHQYPLGMPMSMARRNALLAWARTHNAWVIEDDYDSELRYAGHPFPSLQGLDPSRVIYLGTFSKILFPSLRLGYAVVPEALVKPFCGARILMDRHPPSADQHVLAAFMQEGHLDRHIRRIRNLYARKRSQLIEMLDRIIPLELGQRQPSDQGMHIVFWLANDMDDVAVAAQAVAIGVAVRPVSPTFSNKLKRPGLILGLGDFETAKMEPAVQKLLNIIRSTPRKPVTRR
ncbi:MocR-like pyridoxine biosynthesis transcription factor PdxR [Advenella mimigardefordensis]|uniref:Transcriptional regulator, GntR family n=1 Tax=Advenella mimigardefordensis (strain DSM 17166 / LMG 22922 / DPN7) TaxID=1247726 RepID=W0PII6_ADVMD|nr:PLP-dependent aminotransferase family protein [Advenella mimigardefordensis]AHG65245.1 transcriptional regulator, GntR family [Advenella mimigardefordensis DPN7]